MRSNLTFNFVTDCMNQALAWMYLKSDLDKVRPLGMRGAIEIRDLLRDLDLVDPTPAKELAVAALPKIALAINQDPVTLRVVFGQISGDPYTDFLRSVWTAPLTPAAPDAKKQEQA
jgi:hypothetical protein